jgi:hypothetical protein
MHADQKAGRLKVLCILGTFSFVAALLFVLLPAPSCAPPTRHGGGPAGHGAVAGLKDTVKPLSYWSAEGEPALEPLAPARAPFRLPPLTVNNTAYSMIAIGGYAYHLSSLVTVHSIRRWDPDRAAVIRLVGAVLAVDAPAEI